MKTKQYTAEEIEAAAKKLGFANAELMLAYFTAKVMKDGLYEALRAAAGK